MRGLLTNLLNPKIGMFFLPFLPQFTNAGIGPIWIQMPLLGAIFFAMGTIMLICVALAAGAAQASLARSLSLRRGLNALAATAFGGLGLRLIFGGNTD
ncbi:MAG: threonine/homoserine/homoserine lactone efflux protein [Maricaulis sp.]